MKEKLFIIMSKLLTPIFVLSTTIIAIIINFNNNFEGSNVSTTNVIISVLFVALWTVFSIYKGIKNDNKYFSFIVVYWSIPILLMVAIAIANKYNFVDTTVLILPVIWFITPLYGIVIPIIITSYIYIPGLIVLGLCVMGYNVGKNLKSIKKWQVIISILILIGISVGIKININYASNEFTKYIEDTYPNDDINISNITMNILKWKTTAIATSNEPYYSFYISKGITDNRIKDNYSEVKGKYDKRLYLANLFQGTTIEKSISLVTERDEIKSLEAKKYNRILIALTPEADTVSTIKEIFNIFKNENIVAKEITIEYEEGNNVKHITFTDKDYDLKKSEIQEKFQNLK